MVIKLTSFLYKIAFNSFYSAYLLRSNNYLLSTHSYWSPCILSLSSVTTSARHITSRFTRSYFLLSLVVDTNESSPPFPYN